MLQVLVVGLEIDLCRFLGWLTLDGGWGVKQTEFTEFGYRVQYS